MIEQFDPLKGEMFRKMKKILFIKVDKKTLLFSLFFLGHWLNLGSSHRIFTSSPLACYSHRRLKLWA